MCGFVGFTGECEGREQVIRAMLQKILHRGPDSQDCHLGNGMAMGFARLSIIDLEGGKQPMSNEDGTLWITFNGEIYNFMELRDELAAAGHVFRTRSDTEVLVHGYEEWGKGLLNRLRGMYAFAIWDETRRQLFGARDFFGIKPFYYAEAGEGVLLIGSEIKSFFAHPAFLPELNEERLPDYLTFSCVPGYDTFFKGVHKLPPAHCFTYAKGQLILERYAEHEMKIDSSKSEEQFVGEIARTFRESVAAHKISDVEVGCFLSSGVDSSYTACELAKMQKVRTYTIGFEDKRYSEADDAKMLADEIHVENFERRVTAEEYFSNVGNVQYHLDEPLANPSANLLWFVSERASEDLKVVLSGEGADEMFGGYNVYKEPYTVGKYQRRVPRVLRKAAAGVVRHLPDFRGKNFLIRGSETVEERYLGNSNLFQPGERDRYLKRRYVSRPPQVYTKPFFDKANAMGLDDISKMQYLDINVWMVQEILLKADKMSMAHSLELRVPFLDRRVFELSSTLPTKYKVSETQTKIAMRKAAAREMNAVSANRKKMAFPLPLPEWLREDRYYEQVKRYFESETADRYFQKDRILKLLEDHKAGRHNNTRKIWAIFTFLVWYEQFFLVQR